MNTTFVILMQHAPKNGWMTSSYICQRDSRLSGIVGMKS
jgi:hypothetical protein